MGTRLYKPYVIYTLCYIMGQASGVCVCVCLYLEVLRFSSLTAWLLLCFNLLLLINATAFCVRLVSLSVSFIFYFFPKVKGDLLSYLRCVINVNIHSHLDTKMPPYFSIKVTTEFREENEISTNVRDFIYIYNPWGLLKSELYPYIYYIYELI